ncbi:hypothetical protein KKE60_06515 [Patescibacteria group bacterium]|nr:hypothetical protein [Patescibacteria group bacterium]
MDKSITGKFKLIYKILEYYINKNKGINDMIKLTKEQIHVINKWLEDGIKHENCPTRFGKFVCDDCWELFPHRGDMCPCNRYGVDYIIAECKRILANQILINHET